MSRGIGRFYQHTVAVETFQGTGANGDVYAAPVDVVGFYDGGTKLVRGTNAEQLVTAAIFYTDPTNAALFAPESRVTFQGVQSHAVTVLPHSLNSVVDHIEIALV